MGKKLRRHISFSSTCFCHYRKHTNNDLPASTFCLLPSVPSWLILSTYVQFRSEGTWINTTTVLVASNKSVIYQIDANCPPFQSLNMLPFHIRPERLKLTHYSLISKFSRCYFKASTLSLSFYHVEKYYENINQSDIIFQCPENNCRAHLWTKFTTVIGRYPTTSKRIKHIITWKTLYRRKWTFLSKLDLLEAIHWKQFKSLSLQVSAIWLKTKLFSFGLVYLNNANIRLCVFFHCPEKIRFQKSLSLIGVDFFFLWR